MKILLCTSIAVIAMAFASAATADNYGTTPAEYAKSKALVMKFFGPTYGPEMVRCMNRESGGNPLAANYRDSNGGSYGLLQLNGAHRWARETLSQFRRRMWNPITHLIAAKRLFDASRLSWTTGYNGFAPWGGGC